MTDTIDDVAAKAAGQEPVEPALDEQGVAEYLNRLLGLGPVIRGLVTRWAMAGIGRAVWCVGDRHHQVQTVLHPAERALADTNQTLRNQRPERP